MSFQKTRSLLTLGLVGLVVAGCATHTWVPGPDAKGSYDEASAQCSLMARHSGGGFYASGRPAFVLGAALGAAIGETIRAQNDFNDCMKASGWLTADADKASIERAQAANAQAAAIRTEMITCKEAVRRNPKYAALLPHLMDNSLGHYTLTQMSDSSTPTVEEAALLSAYGDETSLCQDRTLAEVSALDPRAGKALQAVNANQRDVVLALIGREITWGEYSRRTQNLIDRASGRAQPVPRQVASSETSSTDVPPSQGIGITGDKITDSSSASISMSDPHGVFVRSVQAQSPAALAGIRPGDIILFRRQAHREPRGSRTRCECISRA